MPQQHLDQRRSAQDAVVSGDKSPARAMRASDWVSFEKNTLLGFVSLHLASGLIVHGCTLHRKADKEWIGLPGRPQLENGQIKHDADGKISYAPVVEITGTAARERFQCEALAAVHRLLGDAT